MTEVEYAGMTATYNEEESAFMHRLFAAAEVEEITLVHQLKATFSPEADSLRPLFWSRPAPPPEPIHEQLSLAVGNEAAPISKSARKRRG